MKNVVQMGTTSRRILVLPEGRGVLRQVGVGGSGPADPPLWLDPGASLIGTLAGAGTASGVPEMGSGGTRVVWSGSLAQVEGGGLFEEDPRTWGARGWAALEQAAAGAGRVCVRPHARHVVSDVPGCKKLLGSAWAAGVGLLVDPVSMMTPGMLRSREAEDHLRRVLEMVGELDPARVVGVIVAGGVEDEACGVRVVPLGRGVMSGERVVGMAREVLPAGVAWVVCGEDVSAVNA